MNSKTGGTMLLAMVLGVATLGQVQAEEPSHRLTEAWKAALMDVEGVVTQEQHATINSIAYHSAAARLCDGIDLDVEKVAAAMNAIATPSDPNLEDEHTLERLTSIVMMLGQSKGLFLAEGSLKKAEFCAAAAMSKSEEGNDHFFK